MTDDENDDRFTSWVDHLEDLTPENLAFIRALGATSARLHISADTAFTAFLKEAKTSGDSLGDVARDILKGRRTLPAHRDNHE